MTRPVVIWILLLALGPCSVTYACSCRPDTTLQEQHDRADNVLVARISGCAPDRLSGDGYCRSHGWSFETIENLKGSNAFVRVLPSDAGPAVNTCDISLKVGDTYLLFLREGRTARCSGTRSLGDEFAAREVETLRAYRDGTITQLTNPWHFSDSGWSCEIDHQLPGVYMSFDYLYSLPPEAKAAPRMTLRLIHAFNLVGPALLEINGKPVPLTRATVQPPNSPPFSVDGVHGDAALALLDTMSQPADVVVSGKRSTTGDAVEPFRATTNTAQAQEAARRFKECVAAHSE